VNGTNRRATAQQDKSGAIGDPHVRIRPLKCAKIAKRYGLTAREIDVLEELSKGCSTPHIADMLAISEQTVKTHTRHIYNKLGVHKRQQVIDLVENTPKF